jgi:hypothetical protein
VGSLEDSGIVDALPLPLPLFPASSTLAIQGVTANLNLNVSEYEEPKIKCMLNATYLTCKVEDMY